MALHVGHLFGVSCLSTPPQIAAEVGETEGADDLADGEIADDAQQDEPGKGEVAQAGFGQHRGQNPLRDPQHDTHRQ